jgi:hypothetical protein
MKLTQEQLKALISYDPVTGLFRWRDRKGPRVKNDGWAGAICKKTGYMRITVSCQGYLAHRLAWLYMTGEWPTKIIDHKNKIRHDNRWENLRDVTNRENLENRRLDSWRAQCGRLGVSTSGECYGGSLKYKATIVHKKQCFYIGRFATPQEAAAAYLGAKKMIHRGFIPEATHLDTSASPEHVGQ